MGFPPHLCLSAIYPHSASFAENTRGPGRSDSNGSVMDSTAMVLPTSQDVNRQTNVTLKGREHPLPTVQSEQE